MGALARVRVHYVNNLSEVLAQFQTAGYPVYGTLLDGKNMYVPTAIPTKEKGIIVMGNEGNGISEDVRKLVTHSLLIPSYPANIPTSESLNVSIATAIVLAEFRRQHNNN
jgi:TrmH family RNA methyltransferase